MTHGGASGRGFPWRALGASLAAASSLSLALSVIRLDVNIYDEGLLALGAEQILKGRWPLVDFYTPYPPGAFFALALVYKVAGVSLLAERVLSVGLVALDMALGFLLAVPPSPDGRAAAQLLPLFAIATAGACLAERWVPPQVAGALTFILCAGICLRGALRTGTLRGAVATGMLLGVAALWRADFALLAAFAAFIVWLLHAPISEGGGALVRRLPGAAAMTLGALSVAAPLLGLFLILGGVRAFKALFVWPLTSTYHATLPWPDLFIKLDPAMLAGATHFQRLARRLAGWPAYFPLLVLSVGICRLLWRRGDRSLSPVVSWLVVAGLGLGVYAGGRSDYIHILPMLFVSLVLAAALLLDWASAKCRPRWGGGLILLAIAALIPWPTQSLVDTRSQAGRVPVPFPRAQGLLADATLVSDYSRLIRELDQRSPPGSFLYSGAPRHDAFYPNDVLVYFLAERDPATYYWCLDAAVTSAATVQRDMIRDLEAAGVREVVLWSSFPVTDARPRAGSRSLDDWLVGAFGPAEQIGRFSLLHKRAADQTSAADPPS